MQPIDAMTSRTALRPGPDDATLAQAARDLEASFLSIMLREAGLGTPRASFGGGAGEDQFASFLTEAYAERMAERGGIGLAEAIFRTMRDRADDPA